MRLAIRHTTRYTFAEPVKHGLQRLRLTPKSSENQTVVEWSMELAGVVRYLATDLDTLSRVLP